jgi:hypothetical protein
MQKKKKIIFEKKKRHGNIEIFLNEKGKKVMIAFKLPSVGTSGKLLRIQ